MAYAEFGLLLQIASRICDNATYHGVVRVQVNCVNVILTWISSIYQYCGNQSISLVGNFINRAAALKRKSYDGLSGSVYGGCKKPPKNRKFSILCF